MPQTLTANQIAQLAYNAGFRGNDLKIATAVAIAESAGNPMAYNPERAAGTKVNSGSRGLWQIYGTAHPQYNSSAVFDPAANAAAAYAVYREAGNKFTPWSTYKNGSASRIAQGLSINPSTRAVVQSPRAYAMNGGASVSGVANLTGAPNTLAQNVTGTAQGGAGSLVNINLLPQNITDALSSPNLSVDIYFFILGGVLIALGFLILIGGGLKTAVENPKEAAAALQLAA